MTNNNHNAEITRQYDPYMGEFVAPVRPGGLRDQLIQNITEQRVADVDTLSTETMSRVGRVLTYLGLKDGGNG